MGFYGDQVLPRIVNAVGGMKTTYPLRERVPPLTRLVDVAAILVELERDPAFKARRKLLQLIREAPRA